MDGSNSGSFMRLQVSGGCHHLKTRLGRKGYGQASVPCWPFGRSIRSLPWGPLHRAAHDVALASPKTKVQRKKERIQDRGPRLLQSNPSSEISSLLLYVISHTDQPWYYVGGGHTTVSILGNGDLWSLLEGQLPQQDTEHGKVHRCRCLDRCHTPLGRSVNLPQPQFVLI